MSDTRAAPWQAASASLRHIAGLLKSGTVSDEQDERADGAERKAYELRRKRRVEALRQLDREQRRTDEEDEQGKPLGIEMPIIVGTLPSG